MANNGIQFLRIDELDQVLDGLPGKLGDQTVAKILRKSAQPLIKAAKELSSQHDKTGDTTKSIGIITNRRSNYITVGPRRGGGFKGYVGHILEYGAAPHLIKAKAAGGQLKLYGGKFAEEVHHPGIAAQPFMRPAFDATHAQVVEGIKAECKKIIVSGFKSVFK